MANEPRGLLLVRVLMSSHVMNHDTECRTDLPSHYIALMALNVARYYVHVLGLATAIIFQRHGLFVTPLSAMQCPL